MAPVQEAGGQAVVLADDHLLPDGGTQGGVVDAGVLGKVAQDRAFQFRRGLAAVALQAGGQVVAGVRDAAVNIGAAVPVDLRLVLLVFRHEHDVVHIGKIYFPNHDNLRWMAGLFFCSGESVPQERVTVQMAPEKAGDCGLPLCLV